MEVPGARRARGRVGPGGRPGAAAQERRESGADRLVDQLRTDEVDVRVEPARGDDLALARDHLGRGAHDHVVGNAGHQIGVAGLADGDDPPVADADVGLHDAPVVDDDRVRDHQVERARRARGAHGLAHPVPEHLAAAELGFLARGREIALDANEKLRVGQPHAVARRGAVEIGVLPAGQPQRHERRSHAASFASACSRAPPSVKAFRPKTRRAPPSSTSVTRFSSPGSKRTAVPAGTLSRMPNAWARSNRSARLTSKKWKCEPTWIGRSPVLATVSSTVRRPWFATTSPSPSKYSPGITPPSFAQPRWNWEPLANRMMDGDELGAVGERALDLNLFDHLRHSLHHVVATEDAEPGLHQLRHAPPVANALEDLRGDERERFRMIELETAPAAPPRDFGRGEDEQLLLLTRSEVHRRAS